jgi:rare lipoprotein A
MERWLVILSLAVPRPAVAVASPGWPDDHARIAVAIVTLKSAEQVNELPAQEPPKSTVAEPGCNGGRRVIAASYGQGQHTTSSGERFDPHGMTAAHRTLPFGTHLTVTHMKTGKSVIVVVNDRGPFTRRVEIDLSVAAAKAIGLNGTAAVCIE